MVGISRMAMGIVLLAAVAAGPAAVAQVTFHVDDDGPFDPSPHDSAVGDPDEDGSLDHPFDAIQEAIDQAQDGDEVVVADGVYTGAGNKNMTFGGKAITVRSANGPTRCVIDAEHEGQAFLFDHDEPESSALVGFTIRYCNACHGAIQCDDGACPTVSNCVITGNHAHYGHGGGISCYRAAPTIQNCAIVHNSAYRSGGGIHIYDASPIITNCTIVANGGFSGGGIMCNRSHAIIRNCIISGNRAHTCDQIFVTDDSRPDVTYSLVEGAWPGTGNISGDPRLTRDGRSLRDGSPCIDAGLEVPGLLMATDIHFESRVVGLCVDIGADEFLDTDGDLLGDAWETFHFGQTAVAHPDSDEDGDGLVNLEEFWQARNPLSGPVTRYVSPYGFDGWDGLGAVWDGTHGPKATIQATIDDAHINEHDLIVLADGHYTGPGNRGLMVVGKSITIQSTGDPDTCVIDCEEQARGIWFHSGLDAETNLKGVTITNGIDGSGGGIYCIALSPNVTRCVFNKNAGLGRGGGIFCRLSDATVTDCSLSANTVEDGDGGGICAQGGHLSVGGCVFEGGRAQGGWAGGGLSIMDGEADIDSCRMFGGIGTEGGGINALRANVRVTNCTITANTSGMGGGVHAFRDSRITLTNCTLQGNEAGIGSGLAIDAYAEPGSSKMHLTNCILWNGPDQIWANDLDDITIQYSNVQGGWPGEGNIDVDPMFAAPIGASANHRLTFGSPCIDAGNTDADIDAFDADHQSLPPWDLDGCVRFQDEPRAQDTGVSTGARPVVDMGAYEHTLGDLDADGTVSMADYDALLTCFFGPETEAPRFCSDVDLDGNGYVELADYAVLANRMGCPAPSLD